jgi:hypothetical protein
MPTARRRSYQSTAPKTASISQVTSRVRQRTAAQTAPRASTTTVVHISPQKAPSGKPKGVQARQSCAHTSAAMLLPYLSFGTAQRSLSSSRVRASLSSDRPVLPLSVFRRAGATTCVCADAAPNERARTPCRSLPAISSIHPCPRHVKAIVKRMTKRLSRCYGLFRPFHMAAGAGLPGSCGAVGFCAGHIRNSETKVGGGGCRPDFRESVMRYAARRARQSGRRRWAPSLPSFP